MSLHYKNIIHFPIFGTVEYTYEKDKTTILTATRTPWALDSTYQTEGGTKATKTIGVSGYSKLNLDLEYTMGATETTNSIEIMIEGSPDGVNFYKVPNESASGGASTLTAREFTFVGTNAGTATISLGLDIFYKFVRISVKETGVSTNAGSIYGELTLAGL